MPGVRWIEVSSGGRPRINPPRPPTRASETATITTVNGMRITACRKSVMTTAHRPPTTQ
jgi:hypothetical protein